MTTTIEASTVEELEKLASGLDDQVFELATLNLAAEADDVRGAVRKVIPTLEAVERVVCAVGFVPGLSKACTGLKTALSVLKAVST